MLTGTHTGSGVVAAGTLLAVTCCSALLYAPAHCCAIWFHPVTASGASQSRCCAQLRFDARSPALLPATVDVASCCAHNSAAVAAPAHATTHSRGPAAPSGTNTSSGD